MAQDHKQFIFEGHFFDNQSAKATFEYSFDGKRKFREVVEFTQPTKSYDKAALERAMQLAFIVIGTSYYKTFPIKQVVFRGTKLDAWQTKFAQTVYRDGLSQFIYENDLDSNTTAQFHAHNAQDKLTAQPYSGSGVLCLQSGGKDSLLAATLLGNGQTEFTSFNVSSSDVHPSVLDTVGDDRCFVKRIIDRTALAAAQRDGGLNGHIPITYVIYALALLQAILLGKNTIVAAIGHEGEEPHAVIGDLQINHQWSKNWAAELLFAGYIKQYVSADIKLGSVLRGMSELKIAELFADRSWQIFGHCFSSCNLFNYKQRGEKSTLGWCGECPKCANNFLLFAPFVEPKELMTLFAGKNLFEKPLLLEIWKGLLGIDGVMKPFECVGQIDELRLAYHMAQQRWGADIYRLPFEVPSSDFDYEKRYQQQGWTSELIKE